MGAPGFSGVEEYRIRSPVEDMPGDYGLTVRRHERHSIALDAVLSVAPQPAAGSAQAGPGTGLVRFSAESGVTESGVPARVVDLGVGGMGLSLRHFVPRGCVLRVRILVDGARIGEPLLDTLVRVQRVSMTDRQPTYLLGTSFAESSPELNRQVGAILAQLAAAGGVEASA